VGVPVRGRRRMPRQRRCGEAHRDGGYEQDGDAASEQRLFP
jgi:hypothetical protein